MVPTFWDVRRIMPRKVPLRFRWEEGRDVESVPPLLMVRDRSSGCESLGAGLSSRITSVLCEEWDDLGRSVVLSMLSFRFAVFDVEGIGPSLKIWTVSLALLTQRRVLVALKAML